MAIQTSTMKQFLFILMACFLTYSVCGQGISKPIRIKKNQINFLDWMSPLSKSDMELKDGWLTIKLRVMSPEKMRKEAFYFVINGNRSTKSKAGETSIIGSQKKQEYTYIGSIKLAPGINKIQAVCELTNGKKIKSPTKEVLFQNNTGTPGPTTREGRFDRYNYAYWLSPNITLLNNKPMTEKKREFPIAIKMLTKEPISKDDIVVFQGDQILAPSPRSSLRKLGHGEYLFKDYLQLTENPKINILDVQFRTKNGVHRTKAVAKVEFSPIKGNLYVLSIGTSTDLVFTKTDAWDFAELYTSQGGNQKLFNRTIVEVLPGEEATASAIKESIETLKAKFDRGIINSADMIILFLSSHGFLYDNTEFRIQGDDYDTAKPKSTSVSYKIDILDILDRIPCKKIIFIDACHSGAAGARSGNSLNFEIEKLNKIRQGTAVIASSKGSEKSYEDEKWENGAFTEGIIQGLKDGQADQESGNKDGMVSLLELSRFLNKTVPKMVGEVKSQPQHPVLLSNSLSDIAIYVYKNLETQ